MFTYLIKQGSELWMYSNEKKMPDLRDYRKKIEIPLIQKGESETKYIGHIETDNWTYRKNYRDWLSSCQRVQVHPSEVEKVERFAEECYWDSRKAGDFLRDLETGILIPSGALRVERNKVGRRGIIKDGIPVSSEECFSEYAFLNEETKRAEEKGMADENPRYPIWKHLYHEHNLLLLDSEIDELVNLVEQFLITRREK
jgi:hypothetical protein